MKVLRDADGQPLRWATPMGLDVGLELDERTGFRLGNDVQFQDSARYGWPSIVTAASKALGGGMAPDPGLPAAVLEPFVRLALDALIVHVFGRSIPGFGVNGVRLDHPPPALLLAGPYRDHHRSKTSDPESRVLILEVQAYANVPLVVVAAALLRKGTSRRLLGHGDLPEGVWGGFTLAD